MSFTQDTFATVGAQAANTPTVYSYKSTDPSTTVIANDYFALKKLDLEEGDIIFCRLGDGNFIMAVGSGTGTVSIQGSNEYIVIEEESDFPVQSPTEIDISGFDAYFIKKAFTTAKKFVATSGSPVILSTGSFGPLLTYSGTGKMFTITDVPFIIKNIQIDSPNAEETFSVTDTVGGTIVFQADDVSIKSTPKVGTFDNLFNTLITASGSFDADQGVEIKGSNTVLVSIDKFGMLSTNSSFVGLELGTAVLLGLEVASLRCIAPAGAFGISGLANSGNIAANQKGVITGCDFRGGMTDLQNITPNDNRWQFTGNTPTLDSIAVADVFLEGGTETLAIDTIGRFEEIGVPSGGGVTFESDLAKRFTVSSAGVLTYVGETPLCVRLLATAVVDKSGGGSDVLEGRIAVNWEDLETGIAKSRAVTQNGSPTNITMNALVDLQPGDNVRLIFANNSTTTNIDILIANLTITE